VYVLSESGKKVIPVLSALARFGARRLPVPDDKTMVKPRAALVAALTVFHQPDLVTDPGAIYRFVLDDQSFDIEASTAKIRSATDDRVPSVTVATTPRVLLAMRRGDQSFKDSVNSGEVSVTGTKSAIRALRSTFAL
jgi:hypothetical protein